MNTTTNTTPAASLTLVPNVKFAKLNKRSSLAEYQDEVATAGGFHSCTVHVDEVMFLGADEFDAFADSLLTDDERLMGKGGCLPVRMSEVPGAQVDRDDASIGWVRSCILVVAPGRPSIYVDPQGYNYARYVGV